MENEEQETLWCSLWRIEGALTGLGALFKQQVGADDPCLNSEEVFSWVEQPIARLSPRSQLGRQAAFATTPPVPRWVDRPLSRPRPPFPPLVPN